MATKEGTGTVPGEVAGETTGRLVGGIHDVEGAQNSAKMEDLAIFAVEEHNKKANARLEFARVVKAKEQVVAGMMYYLTIQATEGEEKKLCEAKVWVKSWMNFQKLEEFKILDVNLAAN